LKQPRNRISAFHVKRIHEQVTSVHDTLLGRISELSGDVILGEVTLSSDDIKNLERIMIIACGTSYNAGLLGKYLLSHWQEYIRMWK